VKALLIGGTGPTGPHLVAGLLKRGCEVTILHRGVHEPPDLPDVEHIHADPHFAESLTSGVGARRFDLVLATYGRLKVIAEVFERRCDQLVGVGGVPVYAGFVTPENAVPYGARILAREDGPLADRCVPPSPFAMRLLRAEQAVLHRAARGVYRATIVRYPQIYGPRNAVPWEWAVVRRVRDGRQRMVLPDDGLWLLSRCAARNAAAAVLAVVDHPEAADGRAYNCADRDQFSVRQWAELVAGYAGGALEFVGVPSELAPSTLAELLPPSGRPHMLADASAISSELGYVETVPAQVALQETVRWLMANPVRSSDYPAYPAVFDYAAEDHLIATYRLAKQWVRAHAPDPGVEVIHPMPHPKRPGQFADDRGR
jgi:nucleoside-diphosphate-sugar epimerase